MADYDLAIIGGGINGTGIARDAAGRGIRVLLVEQNDLASGTSSASTKLIHGGLRYLERGAFRLVRNRSPSARCCGGWRRTSSARCGSCFRPTRVGARHGSCVLDYCSTTGLADASSCRPRAWSTLRIMLSACRSSAITVRPSNTRTAGSTTRGSLCSTPSMLPNAAPPSARVPAACAPSGTRCGG